MYNDDEYKLRKKEIEAACEDPKVGDIWYRRAWAGHWHTQESLYKVTVTKVTPAQLVFSDDSRFNRKTLRAVQSKETTARNEFYPNSKWAQEFFDKRVNEKQIRARFERNRERMRGLLAALPESVYESASDALELCLRSIGDAKKAVAKKGDHGDEEGEEDLGSEA
jgi:hypothetical protein